MCFQTRSPMMTPSSDDVNHTTLARKNSPMNTGTTVLNAEQQQAAEHIFGALLVQAPVGTGKTRVLTQRLINAIHADIPASRILCLSFTHKAANEIRERVRRALPLHAREITVSTVHSLCATILRQESRALALPADFTIYDEEDSRHILRNCIGRQITDMPPHEEQSLVDLLLHFIGVVKHELTLHGRCLAIAQIFDTVYHEWGKQIRSAYSIDHAHLFTDYNAELSRSHAVDFSDLILRVTRLFRQYPSPLARWQAHFDWIQVDEVQDTNPEEYAIIAHLAASHGNLAFFGDVDQTLYEWRGSDPAAMLQTFRAAFHPVRDIHLVQNYRATAINVAVCQAVISGYRRAVHRQIICAGNDLGVPVVVHCAPSVRAEGYWIADEITRLRQNGDRGSLAVLTRTHNIAREISDALAEREIAHAQLEQFPFYRRTEVKDALAYLRLLRNPYDTTSLRRILQMPLWGIREATLTEISAIPDNVGLRLIDLANLSTFQERDPYGLLLARLAEGRVVIFDVETTGTDTDVDEIIELSAVRVDGRGTITERFQRYLRPSRALGESTAVHHYDDAFLRINGEDPATVMGDFLTFSAGCVLVGHNVTFDIGMLTSNAQRYGYVVGYRERYDTLDIARRQIQLERYRLGDVCDALHTTTQPNHSAVDDVKATQEVLRELLHPIRRFQGQRRVVVQSYRTQFEPLAQQIAIWRDLADRIRPHQLLRQIVSDSGLGAHLASQTDGPRRLANLHELLATLERIDDPEIAPARALDAALSNAALGHDIDRCEETERRVQILTVHQAKGMEFDTVFIAGAVDSSFPVYRSHHEQPKLDEEHRIFYVAVSRARGRLYLTHHTRNAWNRSQQLSRYAGLIPPHLRTEDDTPMVVPSRSSISRRVSPPYAGEDELF